MPQHSLTSQIARCTRFSCGRKTQAQEARSGKSDNRGYGREQYSGEQMRFFLGISFAGTLALLFAIFAFSV